MPVDLVAPGTPALRAFVRDTLGCTCPETVFDVVRRGERALGSGASFIRLVIGDRLLVYLVGAGAGTARVVELAAAGPRDRDASGLHRFRLVVGLPAGAAQAGELADGFAAAVAGDPKAHLHCVPAVACGGI
jgi:hypothetical protein